MRIDAVPTLAGHTVLACAICGEVFVTSHVIAVLFGSDDKQVGCVCDACMALGHDAMQRKLHERAEALRAMAWWLDEEMGLGIVAPTPAAWRAMRAMPLSAAGVV